MRNNAEKFSFPQDAPQQQSTYSRPTDFVNLPSQGKFYPEAHPYHNKEEIEVTFMTTKEEDILMSPSLNEKGIAFDRLIESLTVDKVKANSLLLGDKNAILLNARKNAYGSTYKVSVFCESCLKQSDIDVDLDTIGSKQNNIDDLKITEDGTFTVELPRTKATVELKLMTSEDEIEIVKRAEQKSKHNLPETVATDRLRQMIVSVSENNDMLYISDFISKMPIADSRFVKKKYLQVNPDVDFTYEYECEDCSHVNKGGVPMSGDFFWPDE